MGLGGASMITILAIDDDPGVLGALQTVLEPPDESALDVLAADVFGEQPEALPRFRVQPCGSGEAGVAWFRAQVQAGTEPGVAFVDMRMPGGWDGVQTIRELWKLSADLQVVICTAHSDYTWSDLLSALGTTDSMLVLKKPFDALEVRQAALALGRKWRLGREQVSLQNALSQAQRLEVIGRLAGGVAHDFNNLLMAMLGEIAVLRDEIGMREEIAHMQEIIAQATEITRTLALFGKGRAEIAQVASRVEIGALLGGTLTLLRRLIPGRIDFQVRVEPDSPPVHMVAVEMHRAILNLVLNAVDAIPGPGRVEVRANRLCVSAEGEERGRDWLQITVSDTGVGMSESVRRRLFQPFFTTKPEGKGTGLGLMIVREVVERAGGVVGVRSTPGQGTVFEVRLPAAVERSGENP
jgi:two-component system NtrC family sensor kinase